MKTGIATAAALFAIAGLAVFAIAPQGRPEVANEKGPRIKVASAVYDGTSLFLKVRNTGASAIGELECELVNYTPGRQIDNGSANVWFEIRGGIEPGEAKQLQEFVTPFESDIWLTKGLGQGDRLLGRIGKIEFSVIYKPR